jgi:hypothetical protein
MDDHSDSHSDSHTDAQKSTFNRILLIVLVVLFVATLVAFTIATWVVEGRSFPLWETLLNALILSIPLVLLYGSIYVLAVGWREHSRQGRVSPRLAKIIHWAPRAAAILIILFVSLFSLDVFEMEASPLELLGGFIMHNIPSIVMIVLLAFAWKRPAVGFAAFLVAAALFALFFVRSIYALPNLLLFVTPLLLVAFLFYADWQWLKPEPPAQDSIAA